MKQASGEQRNRRWRTVWDRLCWWWFGFFIIGLLSAGSTTAAVVYVINGSEIYATDYNGQSVITVITGLSNPCCLAVADNRIFWVESAGIGSYRINKIRSARTDGSNLIDVITQGVSPSAIAVDPNSGKLYWRDQNLKTIKSSSLNGENIVDIASTTSGMGIALDIIGRKIYWTDIWTDTNGSTWSVIRQSNLDGSGVTNFTGLGTSHGENLAVDHTGGRLFSVSVPSLMCEHSLDTSKTSCTSGFCSLCTLSWIAIDEQQRYLFVSHGDQIGLDHLYKLDLKLPFTSSFGQTYPNWLHWDNLRGIAVAPAGDISQKKVVFVPGFLGSRLYRENADGSAGDQLWETACNGDIEYLMPNSDGSFNSDRPVTLKAKSYGAGKSDHGIVNSLQAECAPEGDDLKYQYLIDFLDSTVGTQNWKAVPWDWRLSLDEAAENLRSEIDQMAAQGIGKVVLITHSTGGLLARAYLKKYGSAKVERFISVAAPHLGTPIAFRELLHGDREIFLNGLVPQSLWRQIGSRMHSAHQLLPTQESFEIAQAYKDFGPVYNKKRLWSLQRFQDNCSQGWKFNIPARGHSTQDQFFRWLEDHPDMVQEGNIDYPLELSHPFLDRTAIMQGSGGALDWVPDIPVNLVYGLGVSTHIRTSYTRQLFLDRRNRIATCGDITREYDKNLYGDGTVPSWSARSIPHQNEEVSLHPFSLSGVGGKDYDHSTIFGHPEIQNLLKSLLVDGSTATAMAVSSEEPRRLAAAATTTPAMSVFVTYGQHVQLHAYDSQNRHTGPLPNGTEETAIPVSSYYSDGFTHKVWLPGDARAYRVEVRALQNDADVILRAESWNEDEQIAEAEFAPQRLAVNGTVTITGSDSTTGMASDLVIRVDTDGDGNPDETVPPLVLHLLTVTPPTNGSVQSKPDGIDCGTECSAPFVEGVEVILTATPQLGYAFTGWGGACNGTGTCTVTMNQPLGVTATFAKANRPPVANAGPDQTVECTGPTGASVTLDGLGSSDPDGDPLTFTWTGTFGTQSGAIIQPTIPLGAHDISLQVTDGKGGAANDTVNVTVRDTTPPTLSVELSPNSLWPPNHKMVTITASVQASDTCDPNPMVTLVSITSNEPDNGLGDGDTPNDIQGATFGTDDRTFALRAERSGAGAGRIYTATYQAKDRAGKTSTTAAQVVVPHD